jgi:hypothetical protein
MLGFGSGLSYTNSVYFLLKDPIVKPEEREYYSVISNIAVSVGSLNNQLQIFIYKKFLLNSVPIVKLLLN